MVGTDYVDERTLGSKRIKVMRVTILQPSYLPWLGYFEQMSRSDKFVLLDDVQYTRRDWSCSLYTSDDADDRLSVAFGGRPTLHNKTTQ